MVSFCNNPKVNELPTATLRNALLGAVAVNVLLMVTVLVGVDVLVFVLV